jgi:maltose O-acetyltransferase
MKKWLADILIRVLLNGSSELKKKLFTDLTEIKKNSVYDFYRSKYTLAKSFRFNGVQILFYGNGSIICGENSYIGNYSTIQSADNCRVVIGNNCSLSHNVRIYTSSNVADQDLDNAQPKQKVTGDVVIGNGVWIGANVFIKEGIAIGDNAIVGANSVITKNIEANGIYGGVPAKLIRMKTAGNSPVNKEF